MDDDFVVKSGDMVFLRAHTGSYIDVEGDAVRARWSMRGDFQRITIEKDGGGTIRSGDTIFLTALTEAHLEVEGNAVLARWSGVRQWQKFIVQKKVDDNDTTPISIGDVVFLKAYNGNCLDVEGSEVKARWSLHGPWQEFTITLALVSGVDTSSALVASENEPNLRAGYGNKTKESDQERTVSVLDALRIPVLKKFESRCGADKACRQKVRSVRTGTLAAVACGASAVLVVLLVAKWRVTHSRLSLFSGGTAYQSVPYERFLTQQSGAALAFEQVREE